MAGTSVCCWRWGRVFCRGDGGSDGRVKVDLKKGRFDYLVLTKTSHIFSTAFPLKRKKLTMRVQLNLFDKVPSKETEISNTIRVKEIPCLNGSTQGKVFELTLFLGGHFLRCF